MSMTFSGKSTNTAASKILFAFTNFCCLHLPIFVDARIIDRITAHTSHQSSSEPSVNIQNDNQYGSDNISYSQAGHHWLVTHAVKWGWVTFELCYWPKPEQPSTTSVNLTNLSVLPVHIFTTAVLSHVWSLFNWFVGTITKYSCRVQIFLLHGNKYLWLQFLERLCEQK